MTILFDKGYCSEPFQTLCFNYPGVDAYPQSLFRVEWGPIFHRGRLDGSAKVLLIGQDPAQHETIIRRILVGEAGRRIQGFLAKMGITESYIMINAFLYSVYGSINKKNRHNNILVGYRNQWIHALLESGNIEAIVSLGKHADEAWQIWKETDEGKNIDIKYVTITHPTHPESFSRGDKVKLVAATKKMLQNWNDGLQNLFPAIKHPDKSIPLVLYGDTFAENDKVEIPEIDIPAGLPVWMRKNDGWAKRVGTTYPQKRSNITLTVPKGVINID